MDCIGAPKPGFPAVHVNDLDKRTSLTAGLLSDTHLPYRMKRLPEAVLDGLDGVDVILHAGDVDRPEALEPLREIAPVYAVRGNMHLFDLSSGGGSLPRLIELHLAGHTVLLTHGYLPGVASIWFKGRDVALRLLGATDNAGSNACIARRLARLCPEADAIVFGHTHRAHVEWIGDTLLVNPGAVCPTPREQPTMARMWLGRGVRQVEIVQLAAFTSS
jgi:predicted phosphodiesterase